MWLIFRSIKLMRVKFRHLNRFMDLFMGTSKNPKFS